MSATTTPSIWLALIGLVFATGALTWGVVHERAKASTAAAERARLIKTVDDMKETEQQLRSALALARQPAAAAGPSSDGSLTRGVIPTAAASGMGAGSLTSSIGSIRALEIPRAHQITMIRMRYTKLLQDAGLSEPELEALLPVLSDLDHAHQNNGVALREMSEQERAEFLVKVGKVIGPERAEHVLRFKQQLPVRMEVGIVKAQLDALGAPLSRQQEDDIVAKLSANGASLTPTLPKPGAPASAGWLRNWRREQNQRLLGAAEGVLTPQQIQRFTELQDMNDAMAAGIPTPSSGAAGAAAR